MEFSDVAAILTPHFGQISALALISAPHSLQNLNDMGSVFLATHLIPVHIHISTYYYLGTLVLI